MTPHLMPELAGTFFRSDIYATLASCVHLEKVALHPTSAIEVMGGIEEKHKQGKFPAW